MSLFSELRRRNVFRMAALYVVGAWLIVQVAETVLPAFDVPGWVLRALILLLAIGFVPSLVLAWVFEMSSDGIRRDREAETSGTAVPRTAQRMDRVIIGVLLLALGYFVADRSMLHGPDPGTADRLRVEQATAGGSDAPGPAAPPKSIAVLAFADLSADRNSEYFADGIAEEILNALAKVRDLKVAGRTSSFHFRRRDDSLQAIGAALGVAHVLEGSVRRQGDRVRISAQLTQVSDGFNRWSETFEGDLGDVFALQERIARSISEELQLLLDAGQQTRLVDAGTTDPKAYALFLHATGVFNRRESGEFRNAIALLEEAIQLDPQFAPALSRLAALHALAPEYLGSELDASVRKAEELARQALHLRPMLAEPHAVIGYTMHTQRRFLPALEAFEHALAIEPNDPLSNFWRAATQVASGMLQEGRAGIDRTLTIDPLLPNALHHRGRLLEWMGDLDGARDTLQRARSVGARNVELPMGYVSLRQGRTAEALIEISAGIQFFSPGLPADTGDLVARGILGDQAARAAALKRLRAIVATAPEVVPGIVPFALMALDEPDEALQVIAAYPTSSNIWHAALWSPRGQAARASPAFAEFARRVGFAELWDSRGPPDLCRKDDAGDYRCK
jgi:TolB-like protein